MTASNFLHDLPTPERVLIVLAHPDDAEYFAGGTLALWAKNGAHLTLLLVTSGGKGSSDLSQRNPDAVAQVREDETRAAVERLGIAEVIFLRWPDGEITPSLALRRAIVRMIRLKRPDAVMSSDPLRRWGRHTASINHPDHFAVAEAVQAAVYPAARDHLNFPELFLDEGLEPHITRWLYMSLPTEANYRVEITEVRADQIAALELHSSQITDKEDWEDRMSKRIDTDLTGDGPPRYAEYFRVFDLQ
jgi:LmbE family N-acetylglucosaminyl deacetylase